MSILDRLIIFRNAPTPHQSLARTPPPPPPTPPPIPNSRLISNTMLTGTYSYTETTTNVTLTIPLKGTSPQALDVLLTKATLRVSFLPFLIDLCLAHDVDDVNSKAVLKDGILTITLFKLESKLWGDLLYDGTKDEIANRRDVALAERTARVQRQHQEVLNQKAEEERMTLRTQMALEENERQMIDDKKAEEKQAAEQELYKAFVEMEVAKQKKEPEGVDDIAASSDATSTVPAVDDASATGSDEGKESADAPAATRTSTSSVSFTRSADETSISLPPPRKAVRSTFKHTPRLFKTPSRESTMKQEKEFLAKNRSHLHASITGKDVAESDPMWLLQKGDKFLSNGDYRSAINAYSSALETDDTLTQALSNRATCHLHLRSYDLCKADCSAALALLEKGNAGTSHTSSCITTGNQEICTSKLKVTLLRTRSVARIHLGEYQGSIDDKIKVKARLGPDDGAALQELDREIAAVESQNQALQ